jgi:sucrose phosphorylase
MYSLFYKEKNDFELYEKTKQPRDVNRHNYTPEEIAAEIQRPVVKKLLELLQFRNTHPAFGGACRLEACGEGELVIRRENGDAWAELRADFQKAAYEITCS